MKRIRHKVSIGIDNRCPQGNPFPQRKAATNFNLEINLPCGAPPSQDPYPYQANTNMTVTGFSTISNNITFQVWYTDSTGADTPLTAPALPLQPVQGQNYFSWSVAFQVPQPGDYTFNMQGTYQPPGAPGSTTILISAPFTTA
jgi:hypothetical protein